MRGWARAALILAAVLVAAASARVPARVVVAVGDSLTAGMFAAPGHRWPDRLALRLRAAGLDWRVVDAGVNGNRLLADGMGPSILSRFDHDALGVPGVKAVVLLAGTNDLGFGYGPVGIVPGPRPPPPTAADLEAGYRQLVRRAHARGVKIYGATLPPFGDARYWTPAGEAARQAVNAWMRRGGGGFDGLLDADAAWRDPARPARIRDGLHMPDGLHGSDAGYAALGDAVPLGWFR